MYQFEIGGRTVMVSLVDDAGQAMPLYYLNGRYYVQAIHGLEYQINVANLTRGRIEVLTSIDGRNTLTNNAASFSMRGMIIRPRSTYKFSGWRINDSQTKPFVFTAFDEDTVAKQATGSNMNLGVISVAVFEEEEPEVFRGGLETYSMGTGTSHLVSIAS